ncbi:hypothetical protein MMC22_003815 [Lobaria immixta]|nr:hypothetical protein [Lobaria immixta]
MQNTSRPLGSYTACGHGVRSTVAGTDSVIHSNFSTFTVDSQFSSKAYATSVISTSGFTSPTLPIIPNQPATTSQTLLLTQTPASIATLSKLSTSAKVCLGFDIYAAVALMIVLIVIGVRGLRKSGARKKPSNEQDQTNGERVLTEVNDDRVGETAGQSIIIEMDVLATSRTSMTLPESSR